MWVDAHEPAVLHVYFQKTETMIVVAHAAALGIRLILMIYVANLLNANRSRQTTGHGPYDLTRKNSPQRSGNNFLLVRI